MIPTMHSPSQAETVAGTVRRRAEKMQRNFINIMEKVKINGK